MENKKSAELIADIISQDRFEHASKIISERIEVGYYNPTIPSEKIHAIPEAFFTTFKNISDNEIVQMLEKHDIVADEGQFKYLRSGDTATYEDVLSNVLSSKNIEKHTAAFLRNELGDIPAQQYLGNTRNQKIVAENLLTEYFKKSKITKGFAEEFQDKGLFNIAQKMLNIHEYPVAIKIPSRYKDVAKIDNKGLPYFALMVDGVVADFSSAVEIRHMLKDPVVTNRIKEAVNYELVVKPERNRKARYEI